MHIPGTGVDRKSTDTVRRFPKGSVLVEWFTTCFNPSKTMEKIAYRKRIITHIGAEYFVIRPEQIAFITTDQRNTLFTDGEGRRYSKKIPLSRLEGDLDPERFFRINRQCIINIEYIRSFHLIDSTKMVIHVKLGNGTSDLMVSQEKLAAFRRWLLYS